jgi:hypothetical protein
MRREIPNKVKEESRDESENDDLILVIESENTILDETRVV